MGSGADGNGKGDAFASSAGLADVDECGSVGEFDFGGVFAAELPSSANKGNPNKIAMTLPKRSWRVRRFTQFNEARVRPKDMSAGNDRFVVPFQCVAGIL